VELKAGQRIAAPFLAAPAEVKKFETHAGYFLLEVVLDDGHHTYKPLRITDDQLAQTTQETAEEKHEEPEEEERVEEKIGERDSTELIDRERKYKRVRLVVKDIPTGKIADVNRGILLPLSAVVGEFKFTLEIDISSAEGISQSTLENKIKETIRQIGARLRDEQLE
jgi:hypothetical protein